MDNKKKSSRKTRNMLTMLCTILTISEQVQISRLATLGTGFQPVSSYQLGSQNIPPKIAITKPALYFADIGTHRKELVAVAIYNR